MGMLRTMNFVKCLPPISYNTDTNYDLATGVAIPGYDGKFYIDGGINRGINSIIGRVQTYKSTTAGSLIARSCALYGGCDCLVLDTEMSLARNESRFTRLAGEYAPIVQKMYDDGDIKIIYGTTYTVAAFYAQICEICEYRKKNKKDFIVESPFLDNEGDGLKRMKVWKPFYIFIDTLTLMRSDKEMKALAGGLDESSANTAYMLSGKDKTTMLIDLRCKCDEFGLCVICTAHVDDKIDMDPYNPSVKTLQFMRQNDKIKGTGSSFQKISIPMVETRGLIKLLNSSKSENLYKYNDAALGDLNQVSLLMQRSKTQMSGFVFNVVESQNDGIVNSLSDYHALRSNKYAGLIGNEQRHELAWYPGTTVTRNSVYDECSKSYEFKRALQLMSQYQFVQTYWNIKQLPIDFSMTLEEAFTKLSAAKIKWNDILNSRGYWTYGKCDREYLSIFDVMAMINK